MQAAPASGGASAVHRQRLTTLCQQRELPHQLLRELVWAIPACMHRLCLQIAELEHGSHGVTTQTQCCVTDG